MRNFLSCRLLQLWHKPHLAAGTKAWPRNMQRHPGKVMKADSSVTTLWNYVKQRLTLAVEHFILYMLHSDTHI